MDGCLRILVVDDQPIVHRGIQSYFQDKLIQSHYAIKIVGCAVTHEEALQMCQEYHPHVVLMDLAFPSKVGPELTKKLKAKAPYVKVLIYTTLDCREYIQKSFQAGANGYLLKSCHESILFKAIKQVWLGHTFFDERILPYILDLCPSYDHFRLSDSERKILQLTAQGLSCKQIANQLNLSLSSVDKYRRSLKEKLATDSVAGLTQYAIQSGLI